MSKLDYVTIAIVAICILAIVFFIYKMTDLFGDKQNKTVIENVIDDPIETEDDIYDGSENAVEDEGENGSANSDEESTPNGNQEDLEESDASGSEAEDDVALEEEDENVPSESYGSTGKYMVLAGAFEKKSNAEQSARRLRSLGYEHAKVESFDRGKFAVVLVDRFDSKSAAEKLVTSLKKDGVKSYVKAKN